MKKLKHIKKFCFFCGLCGFVVLWVCSEGLEECAIRGVKALPAVTQLIRCELHHVWIV